MMTFTIEALKRLDAEASPGKWDYGNETKQLFTHGALGHGYVIALDIDKNDAALIVAMRNALPELLKALETPVAWRTRQRVGPYAPYSWVYTDKQAVTSDDDVYETMPLFTLPPHGGVDVG